MASIDDLDRKLDDLTRYVLSGSKNQGTYNNSTRPSSRPSKNDASENDGYAGMVGGVEIYSKDRKELQDRLTSIENKISQQNERVEIKSLLLEFKKLVTDRNIATKRNSPKKLSEEELTKLINSVNSLRDTIEEFGDEEITKIVNQIDPRDANKNFRDSNGNLIRSGNGRGPSENALEKDLNDEIEKGSKLEEKRVGIKRAVYDLSRKEYKILNLMNKELDYGLTASEKMERSFERMGINTDKFRNGLNELKSSFNGLVDIGKKFLEPWSKADQAASDFAKHIGLSGDQYEKFRRQIVTTSASRNIGAKTGVSLEEQFQNIGTYSEAIGRNVGFSADQQEDMAHAIRLGQDGGKLAQNYMQALERFGMGPDSAIGKMSDLFKMSQKGGVAFNKTSEIFLNNIKLAQNYTFKKGVDGLMQMAKRSAEIKMNLNEVAKYVEKTSTLEGSLQSAAGLSVLGGPFAAGADPITMLYNGLNDFEGASKQMEGMLKSLVHFDESTKQLEMSSFNRMRLRAAAEAMGVDYGALSEQAFALGREERIKPILEAKGISSESDDYQAILNKAYLDKEGNAKVNVNGESVDVDKLTEAQISDLKRTDFSDSDNIRTITSTLLGWDDKLKGVEKGVDEQMANTAEVTKLGEKAKGVLDFAQQHTELLAGIKMGVMAIQGLMMLGGIGNGIGNMGRGLFGGGGRVNVGGIGPRMGGGIGSATNNLGAGSSSLRTQYKGLLNAGYTPTQARNIIGGQGGNWGIASQFSKSGVKGVGSAIGRGVNGALGGMGGGLALAGGSILYGMANNYINDSISNGSINKLGEKYGISNGLTDAWGVAGGTVTGMYSGAAAGAGLGMLFGPYGAAAGAIIGGAYGGIKGYIDAQNATQRKNVGQKLGLGRPLAGEYTNYELNRLDEGHIGTLLMQKVREQEGISLTDKQIADKLNPKKMALGGILHGRGNGTSDDNLVHVSNGEYIMPEKQTVKPNNRKILDAMRNGVSLIPGFKDGGEVSIDPQGNQMNVMKVSENTTNNNSRVEVSKPIVTDVKLSPLTINGTIKLEMNGVTKDINANDLIKNPFFLRKLTDEIAKNLNVQNHFGYDKETYYKKFG